MAISISQAPVPIQRVGGEHIFVASSTNVANDGFKFLVTIDVDSVEIYKGYHDANPSGRLIFNARKVLESVVETDTYTHNGLVIHKPTSAFARHTNGIKEYTINFGEVYLSSGVLTEFADLETWTRTVTQGWYDGRENRQTGGYSEPFVNGTPFLAGGGQVYFPFRTSRFYNYSDISVGSITLPYNLNSNNIVNPEVSTFNGGTGTYLVPVIDVYTEDDGVLSMSNYEADTLNNFPDQVQWRFYNGSTLLNTYNFDLNTTNGTRAVDATEVDGRICIIGAYPNSGLTSFLVVSNPTWTHYHIQPRNSAADLFTGQYVVFRKATKPCRNDMRRIAWANRYGGYDYFWFEGATTFTLDSDRKTYRKVRGNYSGTSVTISRYDHERENYYNDVERGYKIVHGGITKEERIMLESLFTAKKVWIKEDGNWLPCHIQDSSYERMGKMSRYFTVNFTVKLAYDANA